MKSTATVNPYWVGPSNEANARLIAAAPQLLSALRLVEKAIALEQTMGGHIVQSHLETIRAAIRKATGN